MLTFNLNLFIIIGTVIVSLMAFNNADLFNRLKFSAYLIKHNKQGWRFFSYALVHAGWAHLLINMFVLYSFGNQSEAYFRLYFGGKGVLYYGLLYLGGILFATLLDYRKQKDNPYYAAVGASGAVSAVLFASILFDPSGRLIIFPIPFPIPSWLFGILYLVYSAYMGRRAADNIGHNAHFWGAIYGIVYTLILVPGALTGFLEKLF
jgi:membrane associated rhomboid family serine protease